MGWFRKRRGGGPPHTRGGDGAATPTTSRSATGKVCDCCNAPLDRTAAYYLPTSTVVHSEACWAQAFALCKPLWELFMEEERLLTAFGDFVRQRAAQSTAWAVCEECSEYFVFDRAAARADALNDRQPADCGAVNPSRYLLFAALGWEQVYGWWPSVVEKPAVADVCDVCEKTMYVGEPHAFVRQGTGEHHEAEGFTRPGRGERGPRTRDGEPGWLACQGCVARHHTRLARAELPFPPGPSHREGRDGDR